MARWFWLYRPQAPTARAQAIQVVHMAHAMAVRGHEVTLCVDPLADDVRPDGVLAYHGLLPHPGLRLRVLPRSRTLASAAFRWAVAAWFAGGGDRVVYARSKRYAAQVRRWFGDRVRLVLEAHEVDSALAAERGEDPRPWLDLEARALAAADGVVTNAPRTLALLREGHHVTIPAMSSHNATHEGRVREPVGAGDGVGVVGSFREAKDGETVARAAARCAAPVRWIGAEPVAHGRLSAWSDGRLAIEAPVPPHHVPDRLVGFRVLVLPLSRGVFGEHLCSPLKLQDYVAARRAIVAADLPTVHDAAPGAFLPYVPGDPIDLAAAIDRLYADAALRQRLVDAGRVRTWAERAAEIDAFVGGLR